MLADPSRTPGTVTNSMTWRNRFRRHSWPGVFVSFKAFSLVAGPRRSTRPEVGSQRGGFAAARRDPCCGGLQGFFAAPSRRLAATDVTRRARAAGAGHPPAEDVEVRRRRV